MKIRRPRLYGGGVQWLVHLWIDLKHVRMPLWKNVWSDKKYMSKIFV